MLSFLEEEAVVVEGGAFLFLLLCFAYLLCLLALLTCLLALLALPVLLVVVC